MWMPLADHITLVDRAARAETRADWLMTRVNQLEVEVGALKFELTGKPQPVPRFLKEATPRPADPPDLASFDDMGDDEARRHGVSWDEQGRVLLPSS